MRALTVLLAIPLLLSVVPGQAAAISPIETETLVIRGRFVDAASGEPIPRCSVRLSAHQSTGYDLAWAAGDWCDPPEITTGADGVFRFEFRRPAANEEADRARYHIHASHARHVAWFSHCTFDVASQLGGIDYGDVRLPSGVRPRIRCVDTKDRLQAGVTVWLRLVARTPEFVQSPPFGPHSWIEAGAFAQTDIDGYLHLDDPMLPGEYRVEVRDRAAPAALAPVTVPCEDAIDIVVEALPDDGVIEGRLVDEDGNPVGGALLAVPNLSGPNCRSRRDGYFTLLRGEQTVAGETTIHLARNRRYDSWAPVATVGWGTRDAVIELPARTKVTFEVVTADGAPVPHFNFYCLPVDEHGPVAGVRESGSWADGKLTCKLAPAQYRVMVQARDEQLMPEPWTVIDVDERAATHRIVLRERTRRSVRVTCDRDGKPANVSGALVEVLDGQAPQPFVFVLPATAAVRGEARRDSLLVASRTTDADGVAKLHLPEFEGALHLRVSGPDIQTHVLTLDQVWPDEELPIRVVAGASITGTVGPLDKLLALDPEFDAQKPRGIYGHQHSWGARITVHYGEGRSERRDGVDFDHLGRFRIQGLPPGSVELSLQVWQKVPPSSFRRDPQLHSLGVFDVARGEPLQLDLQLPKSLQ